MKKILIVINMQNDLINGNIKNKNSYGIVKNVADKIRNFDNGLLYVTLDTNENWNEDMEARKKIPQPYCLYMSHGWLLHDEIFKALQDSPCTPMFYERNEDKDNVMQMVRSIREFCEDWESEVEIEICGLVTEVCVIALALALRILCPKVKINIDTNCCAGITEETHNAALTIMDLNGIDIYGDTAFNKILWEDHEKIQETGRMV